MIDDNEYFELMNGLEAVQRKNANSEFEAASALLNVIIARRMLRDAEEVEATLTFNAMHSEVEY